MKRLFLLRHAKSSWDEPVQRDFDRPLNERGEAGAQAMGRYLKEQDIAPDVIVCSPAVRTRTTLARVLAETGWQVEPLFDERIYMASQDTLLGLIQGLPGWAACALIVGHNPGLEDLAISLAARGEKRMRDQLASKYPTGTLTEISLPHGWEETPAGSGSLVRFVRPKTLDPALAGD